MQNKLSGTFLTTVILALVIGFLSGVVGELWLNSFLLPDPYLNFKSYNDLSSKLDDLISTQGKKQSWNEKDNETYQVLQKVRPVVVEIYKYKKMSGTGFETLATDSLLGLGVMVTSDGWLMTSDKVVKNLTADYYVLVESGQVSMTEQVVAGIDSEVVFLKIKKSDWPVAEFGLKENLIAGQGVVLFGKNRSVLNRNIQNINYSNRFNAASLIRSSEAFYRNILLEGVFSQDNLGSPVVTGDGRVIGVLSDVSGLVLPMEQLSPLMRQVVQGEKWLRPYLGIKFYDLTEVVSANLKSASGAQLLKYGGVSANSPAKGVLLPEDIILAVEGEELSEARNLPEMLAQYPAQGTLKLKIKRGIEIKEVELVLGEK